MKWWYGLILMFVVLMGCLDFHPTICLGLWEGLTSPDATPIPANGFISPGYYTVDSTNMARIPDGYIVTGQDASGQGGQLVVYDVSMSSTQIQQNTLVSEPRKFDTHMDVQYHDSIDVIQAQSKLDTMVLKDGVLTSMPWSDISSNNNTYYPAGAYKYGAAAYVPTYEDTVYLSNRIRKV